MEVSFVFTGSIILEPPSLANIPSHFYDHWKGNHVLLRGLLGIVRDVMVHPLDFHAQP